MSGHQVSRAGVTRRSVVGTAATIPLATGLSIATGGIGALCEDWLRADDRLEVLTLAWAHLDAETLGLTVPAGSHKVAGRMQWLDRQIGLLDRKRSVLLDRIVTTPAGGPEEAVGKLLVAKRLLEGEGGSEHDIVADAVMHLAAALGLDQ